MSLRIKYFIFIIILISFSGCDKIYSMLDEKGAQEKKLVGDIVPLEANPTVEEIQTMLSIYGYSPGKIDGTLGVRTRDAVARFQKDCGLEVTRKVDQQTWEYLSRFKNSEFIKNKELNLIYVQKLLQQFGFDPGKIDGRIGPRTTEAVKIFQKKNNLKVDGKIGYQTLILLSQETTQK